MSRLDAPSHRSERDLSARSPDQLVLESSHGFVRALRDPLNAIVLDADGLVAEAARAPGARGRGAGRESPRTARARFERLKSQIEHVSAAIRMLERVLDRRSSASARADLGRIVDEVGRFMAPYAARHGRRLRWTGTEHRSKVECNEQAVWQTLVVLVAERLLAIPRHSTLTLSVRPERVITVEGDFSVPARDDGHEAPAEEPTGLERLLGNPWLGRAGLSIEATSRNRIVVHVGDPMDREGRPGNDLSLPLPDTDEDGCRASSS